MRDERWEADTLFLVFEEDYRFTEEEDEPVLVKPSGLQEVVGEVQPASGDQPTVPLDGDNKAAPLFFGSFSNKQKPNAVEPSATAANKQTKTLMPLIRSSA